MPWERQRNGRRYYTRTIFRAGRRIRQYVGCGPVGEIAAEEDRRVREARVRARAEWVAFEAGQLELERQVEEIVRRARADAEAELLAAGCHKKKGIWRKRRAKANPRQD